MDNLFPVTLTIFITQDKTSAEYAADSFKGRTTQVVAFKLKP